MNSQHLCWRYVVQQLTVTGFAGQVALSCWKSKVQKYRTPRILPVQWYLQSFMISSILGMHYKVRATRALWKREFIDEPHKYTLEHQGNREYWFPLKKIKEKSKQLQEFAYAYKLPWSRMRMESADREMISWIFSLEKRTQITEKESKSYLDYT